ncbi:MAG: Maf family protein [Synergistales bacterium]|nr:Maf family protein [Synergistales bacterium]
MSPGGGRPLLLASASPRRAELLERLGWTVAVQPAGIDESTAPTEAPVDAAVRLARVKAEQVAAGNTLRPVLAADTMVIWREELLGKPVERSEALAMLRRLNGAEHRVVTGVAVIGADGRMRSDYGETLVRFRHLPEAALAAYVASGEPFDKAGAYGIQALGGLLVESLSGCFYNVVGLPLAVASRLLEQAGYSLAWQLAAGRSEA